MANLLLAPLLRWFRRLRYPRLFLLAAGLFVADLVIPDFVPFADELLLGLGTLLLANWKKRGERCRRQRGVACWSTAIATLMLEFDRDRDAVIARARARACRGR